MSPAVIVVAGTSSGVGKTTVAVGLIQDRFQGTRAGNARVQGRGREGAKIILAADGLGEVRVVALLEHTGPSLTRFIVFAAVAREQKQCAKEGE